MLNKIQTGKNITFTAGANVSSGELVKIGALIGVAHNAIVSGSEGEAALEGVYEVPKEAEVMAQGAVVYFNATNKTVTTTSGSNTVAGYVFVAAAQADTTVRVKLLW